MSFSRTARNNFDRVNAAASKLVIAQRFYRSAVSAEYSLEVIRMAGKVREACNNARGKGA